jgi:hypothetical protein
MKYLNYTIEYNENYGCKYMVQVNFPTIKKISFYNWSAPDINLIVGDKLVAVWKVKKLKTKPVIDMPPFITVFN